MSLSLCKPRYGNGDYYPGLHTRFNPNPPDHKRLWLTVQVTMLHQHSVGNMSDACWITSLLGMTNKGDEDFPLSDIWDSMSILVRHQILRCKTCDMILMRARLTISSQTPRRGSISA
jgi:hypothetical protein